jgi:hypothetical protein
MSSEKWRLFGTAEKRPICLAFGENIKAGFAGESAPRCKIAPPRSLRRRLRSRPGTDGAGAAEQVEQVEQVELEDALAAMLRRIFFEELLVKPKEHRVVVGEVWDTPLHFRNALARVLFTIFGSPSLYAESCCVLALHAVGVRSGLVVNVGREETRVLPVMHGVPLHYAASVIPIGARAVELEMKRLLAGAWRNSGLSDDLLEDHAGAIVSAACRVQARGANTSGDAAAKGDAAVYRCAGKDVRIDAEWRTMPCEVLFGYKNRAQPYDSRGHHPRTLEHRFASGRREHRPVGRHGVRSRIFKTGARGARVFGEQIEAGKQHRQPSVPGPREDHSRAVSSSDRVMVRRVSRGIGRDPPRVVAVAPAVEGGRHASCRPVGARLMNYMPAPRARPCALGLWGVYCS